MNDIISASQAYAELVALNLALASTPDRLNCLNERYQNGQVSFSKERNNNWGLFAGLFDGKSDDRDVVRFKQEAGCSMCEDNITSKLEERWFEDEEFGEVCVAFLCAEITEEQMKSHLDWCDGIVPEPQEETTNQDTVIEQLTAQLEEARKAEAEAVSKCSEFKEKYEQARDNYRTLLSKVQSTTETLRGEVDSAIESEFAEPSIY